MQVTVPRVLCVHLPVDPTNEVYAGHQFILRSKDGSYESRRTVADDALRGDRQLTLEFADLVPGTLYTLLHDGGDGTMGTFFVELSYEDLFPAPAKRRTRQPTESLVQAAAAAFPEMTAQSPFRESDRWLGIDLDGVGGDGAIDEGDA